MSNNTEPSANSINLRPMPMSMLLNLLPLKKLPESPTNTFLSAEDSGDSFLNGTAASDKENSSEASNKYILNQKSMINRAAEYKRLNGIENKENDRPATWNSVCKDSKLPEKNNSGTKYHKRIFPSNNYESKQRIPLTPSKSTNVNTKDNSSVKKSPNVVKFCKKSDDLPGYRFAKTPEMSKLSVFSRKKTPTPKIKSGIRKFTPGSGRYTPGSGRSYRKLKQRIIPESDLRDSVRCLFPDSNHHQKEQPPPSVRAHPSSKLTHIQSHDPGPQILPLINQNNHSKDKPEEYKPQILETAVSPKNVLNLNNNHQVAKDLIKNNYQGAPSLTTPEAIDMPKVEQSRQDTEGTVRKQEVSETLLMKKPEVPDTPSIGPSRSKIPATPLNDNVVPKEMPTPSYPQGNSKSYKFKTAVIKNRQYMFLRKLGVGGSSVVNEVLDIATSRRYAVKCVNLATDPELARGYINEVKLLKKLQDSDSVVKLFDYEYDKSSSSLRVVLEVGDTDLSSFLKARGKLQAPLVMYYWDEMLHAVKYIHDNGVIHADLKPANFLLVCGRLKLIDFGIASAVSSDATSVVRSQAAGTYSYISPEALMGGAGGLGSNSQGTDPIKISYRSDVWSLGCILYSMVYGHTPFSHIPNLGKLAVILNPHHRIDYPPAERFPPALLKALKWCLTYNARARPLVSELLAIPYFNNQCTCQASSNPPS